MSRLDTDIAHLYALPLDEFTAARNALAKELKKQDKEAAERVQKLAKPSASAWAVNRLFEEEEPRMKALLAAGEKARKALRAVLTEGGPEEAQKAADKARRRADAADEAAERAEAEVVRAREKLT